MNTVRFGTNLEFARFVLPVGIPRDGWIEARVEISVEGFRGEISPNFEVYDLRRLLEQLRALYSSLNGSAVFRPREEQLTLEFSADRLGHIQVAGIAWSRATLGNRLEFALEFDQSFLSASIDQLDGALQSGGNDA